MGRHKLETKQWTLVCPYCDEAYEKEVKYDKLGFATNLDTKCPHCKKKYQL